MRRKTRFIRVLLLCILAFFIFSSSLLSPTSNISIPENDIPLASGDIAATYYLAPNKTTNNVFLNYKKVGKGSISQKKTITNDPEVVSELLNIVPDYSTFVTDSQDIEWYSIGASFGSYYVVGKIIDKETSSGASSETSFETINEMVQCATLKENDTVTTLGYHTANDGGAGTYLITKTTQKANNATIVALNNGLKAELQVSDNQISPEQCGAYGDGTHDDAVALQTAFDSKYIVSLTNMKTYKLISNGLAIRNDLEILGNNATIYIDDTYAPVNSESFEKRMFRSNMQPHKFFNVSNLNLKIDIQKERYVNGNYLIALQPTFIDTVTLDNVSISISESTNQITNFWMDHGCSNLTVKNCTFENFTTYKEGGIFWLYSNTDSNYNKYNAFDNCSITNCSFSGTCSDEAIAIWGPNDVNADFSNITVNWSRKGTGSSRPINISCDQNCSAAYNITFNNSEFICDGLNSGCDSFIGYGSRYPSNTIDITFNDCTISAKVRDSLIHFQQLIKYTKELSNFDLLKQHNKLRFNNCTVDCDQPITGSSNLFSSNSLSAWANDCEFKNCDITCNYNFAFLQCYSTTTNYYVPSITIDSCKVNVSNAKGIIYKTTYGASCDLNIVDSNFYTDTNINSVFSYRYKANTTPTVTQQNASKASETITNVLINDTKIQ